MNEQLLKQLGVDQQILQQMVDEQAALAEAERLGHHASATRKSRSGSSRFPAFQENGAFIGEQRYQQLLRIQQPPMTASRVRGQPAPQPDRRQAARARSPTGCRCPTRSSSTNTAAQRQGEAAGRRAHRRQLPRQGHGRPTPTSPRYFEAHKDEYRIGEKRKIKYLLLDVEQARAEGRRPAGRHRARLQRQHRAVPDAGAGARQPHPAQDRRQGRRGGEEAGGRGPEAGEERAPTSRRWRRSTPRTRARTRRTAATSTTSAAAAWCRSSSRRRSRCSRARSAIW